MLLVKIIFAFLALVNTPPAHPYYMSVTELKYNATEKSVEGSVKTIGHDLEKTLRKLGHKQIDLLNPKDRKSTEDILRGYLAPRLKMWVNGTQKEFKLLGFEHEGEHLFLHISAGDCPLPKSVKLENSILYDFLKEQINLAHFEVNGKSQSLKVVNPKKEMVFEFR